LGDISCKVCGEPWDAYGVRHHEDMNEREAKAFLMGLGCPCCNGEPPAVRPRDHDEMDFLRDLTNPENDDRDPLEAIDRVQDAEAQGLTWEEVAG